MKKTLKTNLALFATAIALLTAPALRAQQVLEFKVDLNTASLNAQSVALGSLYLDFQLNYGSTPEAASSVTLSNFQFTGGSALSSITTSGTASGSLANTVSLSASSSSLFNELYQGFSPSTSDIKFTAYVSEAGTTAGSQAPTEFTTAIMDSSLGFPAQLFTNASDQESLVTLNLSPSNTIANVSGFASVSSADGNTVINGVTAAISVPEPSTTAGVAGCAAVVFAFCFRRFRKPQPTAQMA